MAQPESYPDWATESDNIIAPPDARVRLGWELNDRPSSSVFNWWKNITGRWIRHIDELVTKNTEKLDAFTHWRSDISPRLRTAEDDLSPQKPGSLAHFVQSRALRARYNIDNTTRTDLDVIAPNRYRLPIGPSAINIEHVSVYTYSRYLYEFSVKLSPDIGRHEDLVFFSQADGIGPTPYVTTQQLDRPQEDGGHIDLNVRVIQYAPDVPYPPEPTEDPPQIVPGLCVVAF